jgi:phosphoglycerate dehydrogenase-like enzyme
MILKVAILDDYANAALESADWNTIRGLAEVTVFDRHLSQDEAARVLEPFDVVCTIRERMALPRKLFELLPRLRLVTIVGRLNVPEIDIAAATDNGVAVVDVDLTNPYFAIVPRATPELAWGLLLATVRHIAHEDRRMREGEWQGTVGSTLAGRTLGLLGLGGVGQQMAGYGVAFGMTVIAWSQHLTADRAARVGARRVDKDELFGLSDVLSIHVVLSDRTRGLVTARELGLMKPTSYVINTSRGPIVEEAALLDALRDGKLAGAGIDVFEEEPLPVDHPFRRARNLTITPHLGYVTRETLRAFYGDVPAAIAAYAGGSPMRVVNPEALGNVRHGGILERG